MIQSSSTGSKRAFLQSKGLTDEEVDEAVRRTQGIAPIQPDALSDMAPAPVAEAHPTEGRMNAGAQQAAYTWTQTFLGTAVMVCAAYGMGSFALPYAVKVWKWLTHAEIREHRPEQSEPKLIELLTKHVQQQEEANEELKNVAKAIMDIQVRLYCHAANS